MQLTNLPNNGIKKSPISFMRLFWELQKENEELKKKNAKLQKALDRKDWNFIRNL